MTDTDKLARTDTIDDPLKVLEILKDAILRKTVDPVQVKIAVRQVMQNFEEQNRLFLIATANTEMPRVLRLMTFIQEAEGELFDPKRIKNATTKDLTRIYALAQTMLLTSMSNIKQVADMRLEMLRAAGGGIDEMTKKLSRLDEGSTLSAIPLIDAQGRDKVRKLVSGLMEAIEKDDSVRVTDDDEEELDVTPTDDSDDPT